MKIFIITTLLLLSSCSTKPINVESQKSTTLNQLREFDWNKIKKTLKVRIKNIKDQGKIPIIDVESSYGEVPFYANKKTDWIKKFSELDRYIDNLAVAFIVFSPEKKSLRQFNSAGDGYEDWGMIWGDINHKIYDLNYSWFMPSGVGFQPDPKQNAEDYRSHMFGEILRDHYPMMGEFFFRHYPSNRQIMVTELQEKADLTTPIDGPVGEEFFSFSAKNNIPFQIHYEIEDPLLAPLDKMLSKYPKSQVIWAHFGRTRKPELSTLFSPEWVNSMLDRHPNLYFDLSCSDVSDVYPPGDNSHVTSPLWDRKSKHLLKAWHDVVARHPWQFMAAFDLGSDRIGAKKLISEVANMRTLFKEFSPDIVDVLAYKSAWKIMFHEDI